MYSSGALDFILNHKQILKVKGFLFGRFPCLKAETFGFKTQSGDAPSILQGILVLKNVLSGALV
jgi:hypothetical protein